ncbi:hypothetical protein [Gilvimarinus sp. 1_MG-2023]|uniref:hypothetical protein n=1 Tax=Gilvimarinus sp. 1_MG-2023 TaxID=3062638 RepID=UPI0026E21CCB|nr:hypothetical protein [Gilvimarinus sp. 1_MG-2023]MDO6747021.1 hypothetical protein [Gilvimarinus sp. 1_MG-2023]
MKSILQIFTLVTVLFVSAGMAVADEFTPPLGLPVVPDARLAISDAYDTAGGDREESIARFGTKASRNDVIDFYTEALENAGFVIYSSSDKADYAMIAAKRDDDRVTIYYRNQSDWVEADEGEFSIKAVYTK